MDQDNKLSKEELEIKELGQEAKSFRESKLFRKIQATLMLELDKEYPSPQVKGWEEQYRYAKALEQASSVFINFLTRTEKEAENIEQREKDGEQSITEDA